MTAAADHAESTWRGTDRRSFAYPDCGYFTAPSVGQGEWLARLLGLDKLLRLKIAPIVVGLPFGLTSGYVPNLPMPAKIVTQALAPVHVQDEFGKDPDIDQVDEVVRARMQAALDALARERRFPVIG